MLAIACLSQKGGVGKSTLSRLIATTYAKAGWSVKIADFNTKQKTSVDWAAQRLDQALAPEIRAEAFSNVKLAMKDDVDLIVFDGKPDSEASTLEIAKAANLVLLPCGVTTDDLMPQVKFAHELVSRGIRRSDILFVLNKTLDSAVAIQDARNFLLDAGYQTARTDLPARTGYQMAQNSGRALTETPYPSLNERAGELAQEIVDQLTLVTT